MNRASLGQEEMLSQLSTVTILYIIDITFLLLLWFVKYIFRIFLQPNYKGCSVLITIVTIMYCYQHQWDYMY